MMLGLPASLWAQVEITAPPPERGILPRDLVTPGQPPEVTRPREDDFRPDDVRVRYDPAFIAPLTKTVRTGPRSGMRYGLSGWTAPPGHGDGIVARERPGWFALGFTFVWDIPMEPEKPEAPITVPR